MTQRQFVPAATFETQSCRPGHMANLVEGRTAQKRAISTQQLSLCPQQRYVKRPKHAGIITFDGNLRELPLHGSRTRKPSCGLHSKTESTAQNVMASDERHKINDSADTNVAQRQSVSDHDEEIHLAGDKRQHWQRSYAPEFVFAMDDLAATLSEHPLEIRDRLFESLKLNHMPIKIHDQYFSIPHAIDTPLPTDGQSRGSITLAKLIYTELTTISAVDETTTVVSDPDGFCDPKVWQILAGLRSALLREFHDFFQISQARDAPWPMQRLAQKYSETGICTQRQTEVYLLNLGKHTQRARLKILNFADRARVFLDTFILTFTDSAAEWEMINDNLHCYLHAIAQVNVDASCVYQCNNTPESRRWNSWQHFKTSSSNVLDDELRTKYLASCPQPPEYTSTEIDEMYERIELPLKECMLWFMSGWLCFGPRIASSFHEYCKVTRFLAWFGATF